MEPIYEKGQGQGFVGPVLRPFNRGSRGNYEACCVMLWTESAKIELRG